MAFLLERRIPGTREIANYWRISNIHINLTVLSLEVKLNLYQDEISFLDNPSEQVLSEFVTLNGPRFPLRADDPRHLLGIIYEAILRESEYSGGELLPGYEDEYPSKP